MDPYARYPSLQGKTVFLSGGSSGIGADMVRQFAAQGARVGFVGRNEAAAGEVSAACAEAGGGATLFIKCDVRDIEALKAAIAETATAFGPITGLVNNAASDDRHKSQEVSPEYWDERMAVNLRHQFFAIQAVAPGMKAAGGGAIVNLGSIGWMIKDPIFPAYAAAKAAIEGLTRVMARELGPDNIRVNCVAPGWIMTERQLELWVTPEAQAGNLEAQCLKHKLSPAEVSRMVLFLTADDSSGCTSHSYFVDAGRSGL